MRIFFEEGRINERRWPRGARVVDAGSGVNACEVELEILLDQQREGHDVSVYTNYLGALSPDYSWNDRLGFDIFFYDEIEGVRGWRHISNYTSRELHFGSNIQKLYLGGEFG